jgi:hypothetical protein
MISSKRIIALSAIGLVALPLIVVPTAMAKADHTRTPVSFTLTPACPNLSVTVMGEGEMFTVTNHRIDANGVDHVQINSLATGSATDSEGKNYGFNYSNHATMEIPPGGFPFSVTTTDHFNLVGEGKANQIHVGFVVRLTITGPNDPPIVERLVNMRGDAFFCDGI